MAVEETLRLDLTDALSQIDELADKLASILGNVPPVQIEADVGDLTGEIEGAVSGADTTAVVEADTGGMTDDVTSAVAEADTVVVPEADVSQIAPEIEAAVADIDVPPVEIVVDADTSQAVAALEDVGTAGGDAAGAVADAGAASGAAAGAFADLAIGAGASGAAVGSAAAKFGPWGIAIAGAAATVGTFVASAAQAEAATLRFNTVFGDFADQVEHLDINGINTSLEDLQIQLGGDDDALRIAIANVGALGVSAGASAEQVAETAEQIAALAVGLSAVRPDLGSAEVVATQLTAAMLRGGRAAARLGLSLDTAAINASALELAAARGSDTVSTFDKIAAGAQLSVDALGDTLGTNVAQGVELASNKLKSLTTTIEETIERVGGPLVDPIIALLQELVPLFDPLANILGTLAEIATSILIPVFETLTPLIIELIEPVQSVLEHLAPLAPTIGEILAEAIELATPFLGLVAVLEVLNPLLDVLEPVLRGIAVAIQAIIDVLDVVLGPFVNFTDAAERAAGAAGEVVDGTDKLIIRTEELPPVLDETAAAADGAAAALEAMAGVTNTAADTAEAFGQRLLDAQDEINGISQSAVDAGTDITEALTDSLSSDDPFTAFSSNLRASIVEMSTWASGIEELGRRGASEALIAAFVEAGPASAAALQDVLGGSEVQFDLLNREALGLQAATDSALAQVSTVVSDFATTTPEVFASAFDVDAQVVEAFGQAQGLISGAARGLTSSVTAAGQTLGDALGEGMEQGVRSSTAEVVAAAQALADQAEQIIRNSLRIQSPSEVMAEIGQDFVLGFVEGVIGGTPTAESAIEKLAHAINLKALDTLDDAQRAELEVTQNLGDAIFEALQPEEQIRVLDALLTQVGVFTDEWVALSERRQAIIDAEADAVTQAAEDEAKAQQELIDQRERLLDELNRLLDERQDLLDEETEAVRQHGADVLAAQEDLNAQLLELEHEHTDAVDKIIADRDKALLAESERLDKAIEDRRRSLFEFGDITRELEEDSATSAEDLIRNAREQNEALREFGFGLDDLRRRGVSEAVIDLLGLEDGPQQLSQIRALVDASDDEILALNEAITERNAIAEQQAATDLADLAGEVQASQATIAAEAETALADAEGEYLRLVAEAHDAYIAQLEELDSLLEEELARIADELANLGHDNARSLADAIAEGLASGIPGIQEQVDAILALLDTATEASGRVALTTSGGTTEPPPPGVIIREDPRHPRTTQEFNITVNTPATDGEVIAQTVASSLGAAATR